MVPADDGGERVMGWMTGWHMELIAIWWVLVVAALIALGWFIAAARGRGSGGLDAEQRLKRRYAAGEIDQGTYQRMLEDLRR
jgi:uncharacterized membrane protein